MAILRALPRGKVGLVDRPKTRYARSGNLWIAYQVHGSGAHDIVFIGGTQANLKTTWQFPEAVRLFERLGRFARVIRFDRRDHGLSDAAEDLTLEAFAADALAVMDAVGAQRPVLLSGLDGARSLAVLAATHPDRVGALVALSPSARSLIMDDEELTSAAIQAAADAELAASAGRLAPRYAADPVRADRLERSIQSTVTPLQAKRFMRMTLASDVTSVLPLVQAPTLVLHPVDAHEPCRGRRDPRFAHGQGPRHRQRTGLHPLRRTRAQRHPRPLVDLRTGRLIARVNALAFHGGCCERSGCAAPARPSAFRRKRAAVQTAGGGRQAAAGAVVCRQSLSRLPVAVIRRHSARAAALPRRKNRSMRRLSLVSAKTGSIIRWRWA